MRTRFLIATLVALALAPFARADGLPIADASAPAVIGGELPADPVIPRGGAEMLPVQPGAARTTRARPVPIRAGRQLRVNATARTMVKASTTSTKEARKAAVTVERMGARLCMRHPELLRECPSANFASSAPKRKSRGGPRLFDA